jgi:hypothetical protein
MPGTISPVSSISIACLLARLRDKATIGVEQNKPICTPGVQNCAASDATAKIATGHKLASGGCCHAVNFSNDRLWAGHNLLHNDRALSENFGEIGAPPISILRAAVICF